VRQLLIFQRVGQSERFVEIDARADTAEGYGAETITPGLGPFLTGRESACSVSLTTTLNGFPDRWAICLRSRAIRSSIVRVVRMVTS